MDREQFESLVAHAIENLPKEFQEKLDNVVIIVEDWPTWEQLRKLKIPRGGTLFGFYEGIPKTQRLNYSLAPPDRITIFQKPIEWFRRNPQDIQEQVRKTVLHEIGHHFGLSEVELRKKS